MNFPCLCGNVCGADFELAENAEFWWHDKKKRERVESSHIVHSEIFSHACNVREPGSRPNGLISFELDSYLQNGIDRTAKRENDKYSSVFGRCPNMGIIGDLTLRNMLYTYAQVEASIYV